MTPSVPITAAAMSAAFVVATLLLRAGLGKLTGLRATAATIAALGVPAGLAGIAAGFLSALELAIALGVLFAPHSRPTQAAVAALGVAFAFAGLAAMLRKRRIRCNCFGSGAAGTFLGSRQVMALPAWLGAALVLGYGAPQSPSLATGALLFAASGLALAALKVPELRQAVREARDDRISAQEMYVWLPQR